MRPSAPVTSARRQARFARNLAAAALVPCLALAVGCAGSGGGGSGGSAKHVHKGSGTSTPGTDLGPAPILTAVTPATGPYVGGTVLTLAGSGFVAGCKVLVDNLPCANLQVISPAKITCTSPAHPLGAVTVEVINPDFQVGKLADAYTYGKDITPIPGYAITSGGTFTSQGTGVRVQSSIGGSGAPIVRSGSGFQAVTSVQGVILTQ